MSKKKSSRIKNFFKKAGIAITKSVVNAIVEFPSTFSKSPLVRMFALITIKFPFIFVSAQENNGSSTADNGVSSTGVFGNFTDFGNSTSNANSTNSISCVNPNPFFMDRHYAYMANPLELTAYGDYRTIYHDRWRTSQYWDGYSDAIVGGQNNDGSGPWEGCWDPQVNGFLSDVSDNFHAAFTSLTRAFNALTNNSSNFLRNPLQEIQASSTPALRFRVHQFERRILQEGNETHAQIEEVNRMISTSGGTQLVRTTLELFPPNSDGSTGSHIESAYIDPNSNDITNVVTEQRSPAAFQATPLNRPALILETTIGRDILCGRRYTRLSGLFENLSEALENSSIVPQFANFTRNPTAIDGTFRNYRGRYGDESVNSRYYEGREIREAPPGTNEPDTFNTFRCDMDSEFAEVAIWFKEVEDPLAEIRTGYLPQYNINDDVLYSYHAIQRHPDPAQRAVIHLTYTGNALQEKATVSASDCDDPITYDIDPETNSVTNAVRERRSMSAFEAANFDEPLEPGETGFVIEARSTHSGERRVCGATFTRRTTVDFGNSISNATSINCINNYNSPFMDTGFAFMANPQVFTTYSDYYAYSEDFPSTFSPLTDSLEGSPEHSQTLRQCNFNWASYNDFIDAFESLTEGSEEPEQLVQSRSSAELRFRVNEFTRTTLEGQGYGDDPRIEEITRTIYTPGRTQLLRTTLELRDWNWGTRTYQDTHVVSAHINTATNEIEDAYTELRSANVFQTFDEDETALVLEATDGESRLCGQRYTRYRR